MVINFVKYAEPGSNEEAAVVARYEGEAFSGKVKLVAEMYDNGAIVIIANDKEIAKGTYEGQGLPTITLDKGTAEIKATSTEDVKLVYTADLGDGNVTAYELPKVAAEAAEAEAPAGPAAVAYFEGEAFGGMVKLFADMYDDKTVVFTAAKGEDAPVELTKGTYEGEGLPAFTLEKGSAEMKATSAEDVRIILTIDIGTGSEAEYELVKTAMEVPTEAEAAPEAAVVAHFEGEAFGGMVKLFADIYDDKTVVFTAAKGEDAPVELTKGTYEGEGLPAFTLEKGSAEMKATSAEDVRIILTIDIGTGSEAEYELAKVS